MTLSSAFRTAGLVEANSGCNRFAGRGIIYGATRNDGVNVVPDGVHVHDLQATILHLMGIDHERLTYEYQGRDFRLTDVHGNVVHDVLT